MLDYNAGGEVPEKNCCDVCCPISNYNQKYCREELSVMDFFNKNKRRYSINEAASVLSSGESIYWSEEEASAVIWHLLKTEKLKKYQYFPWKNKLTLK